MHLYYLSVLIILDRQDGAIYLFKEQISLNDEAPTKLFSGQTLNNDLVRKNRPSLIALQY